MKNLFQIIILVSFFIMIPITVFAKQVQIADMTVANFYAKMNQNLALAYKDKSPLHTFMPLTEGAPANDYIIYGTVLKLDGGGAAVFIYANRADYVSKITIASSHAEKDMRCNMLSTLVILKTLGLSDAECKVLFSQGKKQPYDVWCSATHRRYILSMIRQSEDFGYIRITASDI